MERETYTFSDYEIDRRIKKGNNILSKLDQLIDWSSLEKTLSKADYRNTSHYGRDCYKPLSMFKILLLQSYYSLSDRDIEDHVSTNLKFLRFCGFSLSSRIPDHSTIANWRNHFIKLDIYEQLLSEFNNQLKKARIDINKGTIIDATIVHSASRPRRKEVVTIEPIGDVVIPESTNPSVSSQDDQVTYTKTESNDPDARWLQKGKDFHYGYKATTTTNLEGIITGVTTTPANVVDPKLLQVGIDKLNLEQDSVVGGDKGYAAGYNREYLKMKGLKDNLMVKKNDKSIDEDFRLLLNRGISKIRYVIERTFGYLKNNLNMGRSKYIGLVKTHNYILLKALTHNMIRSVKLL